MKIVLFDSILEQHVCESLLRGLSELGHEVSWTGPVWHGHAFAKKPEEKNSIRERLEQAIAGGPDALFNFRASTLGADELQTLARRGIRTAVWFPDDPVLYKAVYAKVFEHYDIVLHCGSELVLAFYRNRHGRCGYNFPFWTDSVAFPYCYDSAQADLDAVFLGNCKGGVRRGRYGMLASLPMRLRIFGRVENDPAGIHGEFFADGWKRPELLTAAIKRGKIGLNIPQVFSEYDGSEYEFDGLRELGHFELPSRVVQYAACGLPIATMGVPRGSGNFPEMLVAEETKDLTKLVTPLLQDNAALRDLSARTHARFQREYSALSRARFLSELFARAEPAAASVAQRTYAFREFLG